MIDVDYKNRRVEDTFPSREELNLATEKNA